jgi:predicted permease
MAWTSKQDSRQQYFGTFETLSWNTGMPFIDQVGAHWMAVSRGLRSSRGLLVTAVFTMTVAIGLNLAMFGLVDRALLSPAEHVATPEQLFSIAFERRAADGTIQRTTTTSIPAFQRLRDDVPGISAAAAYQAGPSSVVVDGTQVDAVTQLVTQEYFGLLGVRPSLGAVIGSEAGVAVISDGFWRSALGADPAVLGRRVTVRGVEFQVGAVMPRGFSGHAATAVDAWLPIDEVLQGTPGWDSPLRNIVTVLVRVDPAGVVAASTQASAVLERTIVLQSLAGSGIGAQERTIAYWLTGVSALVLLLGLANAGTLLLVRGARRRREFAIRASIGASRMRLLAQIAGESVVVGFAAAGAALFLAGWFDALVRRLLLPGVIELDPASARTIASALTAGVVASVVAALAGIANLPTALASGEMAVGGAPRVRMQKGLLLVQASLSVLLLVGAGLFGRSLYALLDQDFGFNTNGVYLVDFELGPSSLAGQDAIYAAALERLRAVPAVESATVFRSMPFGSFHVPPIAVPGRAEPPSVGEQLPFLILATPEFLSILGIEIIDGRTFTQADAAGAPVVIINETMARNVWPGERAVGQCIRIGFDPDVDPFTATGPPTPSPALPCREVIGVARDVRQRSVIPQGNETRLMQYYVPFGQEPAPPGDVGDVPSIAGLLVKTSGSGAASPSAMRQLLLNGRTDLPSARVRSYASLFERQLRPWRLGTALLSMFGALAVVIAAVGLYAAFAHAVVVRQREMAIRLAVGATPGAVRGLLLRDAVVITAVACGAGCLAGVLAGRSLQTALYGIVPLDPVVLGGAALAMLIVAAGATYFPARAASRADPNVLLRPGA